MIRRVYCISYDLNKAGQDYAGLYDKIKECADGWWHHLDSTWLISTYKSADQIYNEISGSIDKNDSILIIEVKNNCQGQLSEDAWKWIRESF